MIQFEPIGTVRSPFETMEQVPKGLGAKHETEGELVIRPELAEGLRPTTRRLSGMPEEEDTAPATERRVVAA